MEITKKLKNFKVVRTAIITTKNITSMTKLAETEEEIREIIEQDNYRDYLTNHTGDIINLEETYIITEAE